MDKFVPVFEKFIEFNDEILTAWKETQVGLTDDQVTKRFKLYKKTVDPRTHETHMEVVKEAFNREYNRIFSSPNVLDDDWLVERKKDKFRFTFGTQEKYSLMVSDIYQRAVDLSTEPRPPSTSSAETRPMRTLSRTLKPTSQRSITPISICSNFILSSRLLRVALLRTSSVSGSRLFVMSWVKLWHRVVIPRHDEDWNRSS